MTKPASIRSTRERYPVHSNGHFKVGSSFIGGFPTTGSQRYTIGVQQSLLAPLSAPWSAIPGWSESLASVVQGTTYGMAYWSWNAAQDLFQYIDWNSLEGFLAHLYLTHAQALASTIMNAPVIACVAVSTAGPTSTCLASDGLVPTWTTSYGQASGIIVSGPTHSKAQNDAGVNSAAIYRALLILTS